MCWPPWLDTSIFKDLVKVTMRSTRQHCKTSVACYRSPYQPVPSWQMSLGHVVRRAVAAWQKWPLLERALRTTLPLWSWNVAVIGSGFP
eukprot:symbB.v1.2.002988.t1/scaffold159.1/size291531/7